MAIRAPFYQKLIWERAMQTHFFPATLNTEQQEEKNGLNPIRTMIPTHSSPRLILSHKGI